MLKTLLTKQIKEIFRSYFYNPKTGKSRSKGATVAFILFFVLLMLGVFGGIFGFLAYMMCGSIHAVGMDWLYYLLFAFIGIAMGVFGSVFNTYSCLYLSKDNDLLLSLPIPVRTIMLSRLLTVYLLGLMYSGLILLSASTVYWIMADVSFALVIGSLILLLIVSLIVWVLSCVLGFVVAKISLKLKNKSLMTVLVSLLLIGAYYFVYFKATDSIQYLLQHLDHIGHSIKNGAVILYWLGSVGTGSLWPTVGILAVTLLICAGTWWLLQKTFIGIAIANAAQPAKAIKKHGQMRSPLRALLSREIKRLSSNAAYMLNTCLGMLFLPLIAVLVLVKRVSFANMVIVMFYGRVGDFSVVVTSVMCLIISMIYIVVPSVSLEGRQLWIVRSLPVDTASVLKAKLLLQWLLVSPVVLLTSVLFCFLPFVGWAQRLMWLILPQVYLFFWTVFGLVLSLTHANIHWTSDITPIKQSSGILIALLAGMVFGVAFGGVFVLWLTDLISDVLYGVIFCAVLLAASFLLLKWCLTKGSARFEALS